MAIIMAVAGLLAGGIGLLAGPPRGDWGLPLASFSAGVAKVGIILMIFHIIGMILSVMRVLAGGDVKPVISRTRARYFFMRITVRPT